MGGVKGGLMTLSRFTPFEASRYSLQSSEAWPKKLFMLKRCYLLTRFKVSEGKELVLINTHNSAFAEAAKLREKELTVLRKAMEEEYNKGNYVIVGGDWNQNPVPFDERLITSGDAVMRIIPPIPDDFLPAGWQWAYDPSQPTNRDVIEAYKHGITRTTIYDFFVLSPNIRIISVKTNSDGFKFSDHNPVCLKIKLKN
jgi:endonuclease/exonuclease/phosphatase family metal-dependent hydrolase